MRFLIASLAALVSIAYADNGNNANDESKEGSLKNIHPSLPSVLLLSPSSIKTKKQPMRSYLREKLFRRRRPGVLHNAVEHDLELDLPEPLELCGKHSLGILDGSHGACSSEEDVCVSVDEQGMESSWTTPYDEYSDTYRICVPRFLAETYHFQPVNYDDAADDAAVYIKEDHHMLMPEDAAAASSDCESYCAEPRYMVEKNGAKFKQLIRDCYLQKLCPTTVINCWDTSKVKSMVGAFQDLYDFNEPVHCLDTSGVTSMRSMFKYAYAFDQPIEAWDVSSVTSMRDMFFDAIAVNQPIEAWDVSRVEIMWDMFRNASAFDQPIEAWEVNGVTDMIDMFNGAIAFNQPIEAWNVSSAIYMIDMFNGAIAFNHPIEAWNVSSVTFMREMFYGATAFNQCLLTWASKTPSYPGVSSPDPTVAPWCQREVDGCFAPSSDPSQTPSTSPSTSLSPSFKPSNQPSTAPSKSPSSVPSGAPSITPSDQPSLSPSFKPSDQPSSAPRNSPSSVLSGAPSITPSDQPSPTSSKLPSSAPFAAPSIFPSTLPSGQPSDAPSGLPSRIVSSSPSEQPSGSVEIPIIFGVQFCASDCLDAVYAVTAPGSVIREFQNAANIPEAEVTSTVGASFWASCSDCGNRRLQGGQEGIVRLIIEILLPQQLTTSPVKIEENLVAYGLGNLVNEILGDNTGISKLTLELITSSSSPPSGSPSTFILPSKQPSSIPSNALSGSPSRATSSTPTEEPSVNVDKLQLQYLR